MPDPAAINSMFGRIAPRYDRANRVLSAGIDLYWRSRLVAATRRLGAQEILDLATGSGDVAFALARGLPAAARIVGMDFCAPMLEEAALKKALCGASQVEFVRGDALNIPRPDASFDAVTLAFGLRNMADRARCLGEIRRVLRPGGSLLVLEFSQPWPWLRPLYALYLGHLAPRIAGMITGERGAYEYLRDSIGAFPAREALSEEIRRAGFRAVTASAMTAGVVALHVGSR